MDIISIGIDPSLTSTGIVILKGDDIVESRTLPNNSADNIITRVRKIRDEISKEINRMIDSDGRGIGYNVIASIEGFSYGSKGRSIFDIGYLGWRIREDLVEWSRGTRMKWIEVPPSNLKQYATGKGNAAKEVVMMNVFKRWNEEFDDNNQADAFVLAKIGKTYLEQEDDIAEFQKAAMESIRKVNNR